jgi:hypothetical protein
VIWTLVVAPGADNPIPQTVRTLLGTALLLLTAAGVALVSQRTPAIVYAVIVLLNTVLMLIWGQ